MHYIYYIIYIIYRYVKRLPIEEFEAQSRGGKGITAIINFIYYIIFYYKYHIFYMYMYMYVYIYIHR